MRAEGSAPFGGGARFADGAASASRKAAEIVLILSDKVALLVRDFQQQTVEVPRDDADVFIKLVRVQGWFLECLQRRLNTARCARAVGGRFRRPARPRSLWARRRPAPL